MKRVLVTGGTGFIGRHLVAELVSRGQKVRRLIRQPAPPEHLQHPQIECLQGDLADEHVLQQAVADTGTVFHLAGLTHAITAEELSTTNGLACGRLADACLNLSDPPRLMYVSSLAAAGPVARSGPPRTETEACQPVSDYGRSKRIGEIELQKRADRLRCTVIRPGIVLGPHDRGALPMFRSIDRLRLHIVVGMRTPRLSLIGVDDLVSLIVAAADRGECLRGDASGTYSSQGYYFACDDSSHPTYAQLGRRVARAIDRRVFVWPLWRWVGRTIAWVGQTSSHLRGESSLVNVDKIREATAENWSCSAYKATEQLDFSPRRDLDQWLRETGQWYRSEGWL